MIIGYDRNPNTSADQKVQSLMESVQMALNEHTTDISQLASETITRNDLKAVLDEVLPSTQVVEDFTSQVTTTHTKGAAFTAIRVGRICNINCHLILTSNVTAWDTLATIPAGYGPYWQQQQNDAAGVDIIRSCKIRTTVSRTSGNEISVSFCYICQ